MSRFDQKNISHDGVDISGVATTTYGADIFLRSIPDNVGNSNLVAHFPVVPAGAGNITVNLYGGDSASPTSITQTIFSGTLAELSASLRNGEICVGVQKGALKAYNRFGVINSGTLTEGKVLTAITPAGLMVK